MRPSTAPSAGRQSEAATKQRQAVACVLLRTRCFHNDLPPRTQVDGTAAPIARTRTPVRLWTAAPAHPTLSLGFESGPRIGEAQLLGQPRGPLAGGSSGNSVQLREGGRARSDLQGVEQQPDLGGVPDGAGARPRRPCRHPRHPDPPLRSRQQRPHPRRPPPARHRPVRQRRYARLRPRRTRPSDDLALLFEAASQLDDESKSHLRALIEGALLLHQAQRLTSAG
jgi:hypothetical protein